VHWVLSSGSMALPCSLLSCALTIIKKIKPLSPWACAVWFQSSSDFWCFISLAKSGEPSASGTGIWLFLQAGLSVLWLVLYPISCPGKSLYSSMRCLSPSRVIPPPVPPWFQIGNSPMACCFGKRLPIGLVAWPSWCSLSRFCPCLALGVIESPMRKLPGHLIPGLHLGFPTCQKPFSWSISP